MLALSLNLLLVALGATSTFAAPADGLVPDRVAHAKRATCTPASLDDTSKDDTPAIKAAITSCGNGGTIVLPAGKTYSIRTMLDFTGCTNCDFQFEALLKVSSDTTYWATQEAIILMKNINGAKFRSLTGTGVIDGNGQNAYDIFAVDSSLKRPTVLNVLGGSNLVASGFRIKNPPNVFINQKGAATNMNYASLTMDAASKSTNLPKNTDGFDVGESTYTTIKDVKITNYDDCIAFKGGCNYVTVDGVTCSGASHGLSVGSLGKTNADTVKNVYVTNAIMNDCTKAVGIKLYNGGSSHGSSTVSNVTYDGITVNGCEYAAQIQTCYGASSDADCAANPASASLTGINFKNFKGTTNSKYAPVVSNLNCKLTGSCDIHFTNYAVNPPSGTAKNLCNGVSSSAGITCSSGASG
jgi:galacturan 1,4-alpha-galacturonidase